MSAWSRLLIAFAAVCALCSASPVTLPHRRDEDIHKVIPEYFDSKTLPRHYHNATVYDEKTLDGTTLSIIDASASCGLDLSIIWSAHVASPIIASPVIFPTGAEGRKELFFATFYDNIEVLESTGHKPWGWPMMFEDSTFLSSPVLYDIDADGKNDVGVVDKNGNIFFLRLGDYGQYLEDFHVQVPRLKVKKNWFEGLDENYVDNYASTSMFDRQSKGKGVLSSKDTDRQNEGSRPKGATLDSLSGLKPKIDGAGAAHTNPLPEIKKDPNGSGLKKKEKATTESGNSAKSGTVGRRRRLQEAQVAPFPAERIVGTPAPTNAAAAAAAADVGAVAAVGAAAVPPVVPAATSKEPEHAQGEAGAKAQSVGADADADVEAEAMEMPDPGIPDAFGVPDFGEGGGGYAEGALGDAGGAGEDDYVKAMHRHYAEGRRFRDEYAADADLRVGDDADIYGYGPGKWGAVNESDWVYVDPHVLSSVTLADVNGDGHQELIIPVSYYFDAEEYANKEDLKFDPKKFIGGGIACWDLEKQDWTWTAHLDLSTDHTHYKALIKAAPTVADLDGDGRSEVVVGTDMGMLYVLDGETGFTRRFFPMQFHKIQAQVAVADVAGGDDLEIIVADMAGNLVCVNLDGEVLWDRHLSGTLPFTPTIGDVDGDGNLDIVVVAQTKSGCHMWAVHGQTGRTLDGFPIALPHNSIISAPVLLVDLHDYADPRFHVERIQSDPMLPPWVKHARTHDRAPYVPLAKEATEALSAFLNSSSLGGLGASYGRGFADGTRHSQGLHLLVPAHDGHLYIIDPNRGCADTVDLGGEHMSATPLVEDVDGDGKLDILLGTVSGQVILIGTDVPHHPMNSWPSFPKHRFNGFTHGVLGVSIPDSERRALKHSDMLGSANLTVTFDIWDNRREMDANATKALGKGDKPRRYTVSFSRGTNKAVPIYVTTYTKPGRYKVVLPMLPPEAITLVVSMVNEHGQHFEDAVAVSIATRFYIWFKYLALGPVLLVTLPLILIRSPVAPATIKT